MTTKYRQKKIKKTRKNFFKGGSKNIHEVMSYNMSWATDRGLAVGTEAFHVQGGLKYYTDKGETDKRILWKNALAIVKDFLRRPDVSVIGLQEINDADYVKKAIRGDPLFTGGTDELKELIREEPGKLDLAYWGFEVDNTKPTVAILWNKRKLGSHKDTYGSNLYDMSLLKSKDYVGRPIIIELTDKDYILINLHGANDNKNINHTIDRIQIHLNEALKQFNKEFNAEKIYIMGDFNDSKNTIKTLSLNGIDFTYGNNRVNSCCGYGDTLISKYPNAGDYVFGKNNVKPLFIYRDNLDIISRESDHEPVYATFLEDEGAVRMNNFMKGTEVNRNGKPYYGGRKHIRRTRKN